MAEQVGFGYYLKVGGTTDLSLWVESLEIQRDATMQAFSTSVPGATVGFERNLVGIQKVSVVVKFSDDFAASAPHQTLKGLFGTTFEVKAAINGSTPATTNEVLTMTGTFGTLKSGGQVGAHLEKDVTFINAGPALPVFATS